MINIEYQLLFEPSTTIYLPFSVNWWKKVCFQERLECLDYVVYECSCTIFQIADWQCSSKTGSYWSQGGNVQFLEKKQLFCYIIMIYEMKWQIGTVFFCQVKEHPFFKDVNWETLERQKVFIIFAPNKWLLNLWTWKEVLIFYYRPCLYHQQSHRIQVISWAVIYGIQKMRILMVEVILMIMIWLILAAVVHLVTYKMKT